MKVKQIIPVVHIDNFNVKNKLKSEIFNDKKY